jgi:hypothetical protein
MRADATGQVDALAETEDQKLRRSEDQKLGTPDLLIF